MQENKDAFKVPSVKHICVVASSMVQQTMTCLHVLSSTLFHNPWAKFVPTVDINHWSTEWITTVLISPSNPPALLPLPSTPPPPPLLYPPWVGRLWVSVFQSPWWWWLWWWWSWRGLNPGLNIPPPRSVFVECGVHKLAHLQGGAPPYNTSSSHSWAMLLSTYLTV